MATEEFPGISEAGRQKLGIGVGIVGGALFGMVGYVDHADPYAGAVMGLLAGVGLFFLVPYVVPPRNEERISSITDIQDPGGFHAGAAGVAVSGGGFFFMAGMFTFEQVAPAIGLALALTIVEYFVFLRVLPRGNIQNPCD